VEEEYLDMSLQSDIETLSSKQLVELINQLPQAFRESGLPRYHFSVSLVEENFAGTEEEYLHLFDKFPLSIDFQRTRNSRGDGADGKENRFYRLEEIDYVGACLFSRTLGWTFIFAHASCFPIHPKFTERYSNSLKIMPGEWHRSLIQLLETRNE